jgi:hypothetical protein
MYVLKNCCVKTTYGNKNLAIEDFTLLQSTALANALLCEPYGLCHAVQPIQPRQILYVRTSQLR